jgi:transcriptional regulator with XRE-family HTH domain
MTADPEPTPLAYWRRRRGFSQAEMVRATGLSRATYLRLEQGKFDNPPLRYLLNCAVVLEVPVMRLTQPEWRRWLPSEVAPAPPEWAVSKSRAAIAREQQREARGLPAVESGDEPPR